MGLFVNEALSLIQKTRRSELQPVTVAEASALNTRATDVQGEMLQTELVGHTVDVYEVELENGRYEIISRAIPIKDADAVPLLRVVAYVGPQTEADAALLRAVKRYGLIRVRGVVQEVQLRTIVAVVPRVVAASKPFNY